MFDHFSHGGTKTRRGLPYVQTRLIASIRTGNTTFHPQTALDQVHNGRPDIVPIHRRDFITPCLRDSVRDRFRFRTSKLTDIAGTRRAVLFDHFSHRCTKTRTGNTTFHPQTALDQVHNGRPDIIFIHRRGFMTPCLRDSVRVGFVNEHPITGDKAIDVHGRADPVCFQEQRSSRVVWV